MGELQQARTASTPETPESVPGDPPARRPKVKQRRNKPTLSCSACVERKTKCDRNRPVCLACLKRQSVCRYSEIANIIASAANSNGSIVGRKAGKRAVSGKFAGSQGRSSAAPSLETPPATTRRLSSTPSVTSLPLLLSNLPHSVSTPSKIFGEGSQHPFSNYWTCQGGIEEVIGVLPSKDQADILVAKYFDTVDAVYPIINKSNFMVDYDRFWSQRPQDRAANDPALIGLHFVVYAMGTQFVEISSEQEQKQAAEFYASAAHQALRISSYLNRGSFYTVQAIVLLCYFLMNDNKASDAWGFGGVLVRHAYAMGLNRDPEMVVPEATAAEKQQRRKLWQAVLFQDTFLTVLLRLPPTTTFTDVAVDSLVDEPDMVASPHMAVQSPPVNPMSISSIAPSTAAPTPPASTATPPPASSNDTAFIRSMWRLANFVQPRVCTPRALSQPLAKSAQERNQIAASFRALYDSYPTALTSYDPVFFRRLAARNPRQARQNLFLRSNYWHCMMLILVDESPRYGIARDLPGAVEASRQGMLAFFNLWEYFRVDAGVWWVFQHRAFEDALTVAELLAVAAESPASAGPAAAGPSTESLFIAAKQEARRVLDILEHVGSSAPEMQKTRTDVLRQALENISS